MLKFKKIMNNALFITIGAIVTVAAAWWQEYDQYKKDKQLEKLNADNKRLLEETKETALKSFNEVKASKDSLQKVTDQLIEAHQTIEKLRKETLQIARGTGCPLVKVEKHWDGLPGVVTVSLINDQDISINHVQVTFPPQLDYQFRDWERDSFQMTQSRSPMTPKVPWIIYDFIIPKYYPREDESLQLSYLGFRVDWGGDFYHYSVTFKKIAEQSFEIHKIRYTYHNKEYEKEVFEKKVRPSILNSLK
ncbi:MAG: hypothetical protein JNN00_03110 [Chitinophagaceae bacterium]|nr:hypothetical protein [Chitinophagaceae bacterium]